MSDVEIIPIQPTEHDETVTALVALRREYSSEALVDVHSSQHNVMLRACYQRAVEAGMLTRINLLIQTLGQEEQGFIVWRYSEGAKTLIARYDPATHATDISVGGVLVFSNRTPGEERLIPGNWWLYVVSDTFKRLQTEKESLAVRNETTAREKFIKDFTADI